MFLDIFNFYCTSSKYLDSKLFASYFVHICGGQKNEFFGFDRIAKLVFVIRFVVNPYVIMK